MSPCKPNPEPDRSTTDPPTGPFASGPPGLGHRLRPDGLRPRRPTRPTDERLEQFLARLGLVDLQIQLLERSLQTSPTPEAKLAMARRLADLYAERLMAHAEDMAAYNDTLQRIDKLVQRCPKPTPRRCRSCCCRPTTTARNPC